MKSIYRKVLMFLVVLMPLCAFAQQTESWSRISRGVNLPTKIWPSGYLYLRTSDSTLAFSTGLNWVKLPSEQMIEFSANDLIQTVADSAIDTTAFYMSAKLFALGDTVSFSFAVPSRFVKINSIVLVGGTTSLDGDSAAFSLQLKQVAADSAYTRSFGAAKKDTTDLGAGNVQREWSFSSFGGLTAGLRSTIVGRLWRSATANATLSGVYIVKVFIFGVGLN
jgi:hypothetical protein